MMIYCLKCKTRRDDPSAVAVKMKNGRDAVKGKCPECGTTLYKMGKGNSEA